MDDTEYRKKLSEVATWALPKLSATDIKEAKKRGRGRPSNEELYQEAHEEIFMDIYNGVNPTHPPELIKTKNKATVCDDCGCDCPEGRHKEIKLYETGPKKTRNWRERCITCNMNKNPFTGKFDMTASESPHVWTNYLRETKGLYKTAGNEARNNTDLEKSNK